MLSIEQRIAHDIAAKTEQVQAAVDLLDGGATVPFIARYRKEVTGGLDDTQLRLLEERLRYLRELEDRRAAILASVEEQGKLSEALKSGTAGCRHQGAPGGPLPAVQAQAPHQGADRARGRAGAAGARPARRSQPNTRRRSPRRFVDAEKGVADVRAALDGARAILMESIAEDAHLVGELRDWLWAQGQIRAKVVEGKENEGAKFRDYFDHVEPIGKIPSHRLLALMRARNEGVIELELAPPPTASRAHAEGEGRVAAHAGHPRPWPRRRCVAARNRAPDLAGETASAPDPGSVRPRARRRRGRGDPRVRRQPQGPDAGRAGRRQDGDGAGSGHPHRGARWRWSMPPANCWPPTRSTRANRVGSGTSRWSRWRGCASSTTST